jgi:hypothetical protein
VYARTEKKNDPSQSRDDIKQMLYDLTIS